MSKRVVINVKHGGFGLSREAVERAIELGASWAVELLASHEKELARDDELGKSMQFLLRRKDGGQQVFCHTVAPPRDDDVLIQVVEEMDDAVNADFSKLAIATIPDDVDWQIGEYDGWECIEEKHRTWGADEVQP